MDDVLSRARTQIKWEEDPSYHHRRSPRSDSCVIRNERSSRDDKPYQWSHRNTLPDDITRNGNKRIQTRTFQLGE